MTPWHPVGYYKDPNATRGPGTLIESVINQPIRIENLIARYNALLLALTTARELRLWGVRTIKRECHGRHPTKFYMLDEDVVRFHEIADTLANQLQQIEAENPGTTPEPIDTAPESVI